MTLLDVSPVRFSPSSVESHHSVALGAALFTPYIPPNAKCILIQATGDDVRFTLDGTVPTAAIGFRLFADGFPLLFEITERTNIKFFGEAGGSVIQYCIGE